MTFAESKIECGTCKGKGQYHGLGVWNRDSVPAQVCENCNGNGYLTRKVQVNHVNPNIIQSTKEIDEVIETSKPAKKEKKESAKMQ